MIKPDARIIPTQDEFDSWTLHPVSQFVAAAYAAKAKECQERWAALFRSNLIPTDLDTQRKILSTQEECFRAFLESDYLDFLKPANPEAWARVAPKPSIKRPEYVSTGSRSWGS